MNELALFAGAGGGILGGRLLGWHTRCAVEINPYCQRVLLARQRDGLLPRFPIWDDVRTFSGNQWRGHIDVVSGGFPCQDISAAGKGAGIEGAKSSLWHEMARIIGEVRPRFALVENSPMLVSRGLTTVVSSLASLGYDAKWCVLGAHHVGAPHKRDRLWILATDANSSRELQSQRREQEQRQWAGDVRQDVVDSDGAFGERDMCAVGVQKTYTNTHGAGWWQTEPDVGRVAYGVASRVDRLRALGNGQVPSVVALAWNILTQDEHA